MTPADLRARRLALHLSQYELARRLGIPPSTVLRWERGDFPIDKPVMLALALETIERRMQTADTR